MSKQEYLKLIGKTLVEQNGKLEFYNQTQVQQAHHKVSKSSTWDLLEVTSEFLDLALSFYSLAPEFISATSSTTARFIELKAEAIKELSESSTTDIGNLSDIDIDVSWLDIGEIFDGIGDVIGGIIGGLLE